MGLTYYAYDFLTGDYLAEVPVRSVNFTDTLNGVGTFTGSVDLVDPRVQAAAVVQATIPNRSVIVADWNGLPLWPGVSLPRKWDAEASTGSTTGILGLNYSSLYSWFAQRIQATDYSSPPFSGITGLSPMPLWPKSPWFGPLIAAQVVKDALTVPFGNPLGGLSVTLNGSEPTAQFGEEVNEGDYLAVNYPYPSLQSLSSIVDSLSQLGLGVGFDHSFVVSYRGRGPQDGIDGRFEIAWPWRGAPEDEGDRRPSRDVDLARARKYSFPEDGSQTAWQVYEVGGSGAIYVDSNVLPPESGYPLLERVISRSSIQSPDIMGLLALNGSADLALYSYAPVTPVITLGIEDPMVPLGQFAVGDLMQLKLAAGVDPRFPTGLDQTWRLTSYAVDAKDEGDATMALTFSLPIFQASEITGPAL